MTNGRNTTLCHLERDGKYLMLHRVKKANDENQDKWVGPGGKFEAEREPGGVRPAGSPGGDRPHHAGLGATGASSPSSPTEWATEYMHLFYRRPLYRA